MRVDRILGYRNYEMTDHLGNVLASVLDRKTGVDTGTSSTHYAYYNPDMSSVQDYYPYGWIMQERHKTVGDSTELHGYNGMRRDDDIAGVGKTYDFGARIYSPTLGVFPTRDPLWKDYPGQSPYSFAGNNPIFYIDKKGEHKVSAANEASYRRKYPLIMKYLSSQLATDVANSSKIVNGLVRTNPNIKPETVKGMFEWGAGPEIVFVDVLGEFPLETKNAAGYTFKDKHEIQMNATYASFVETVLSSSVSEDTKLAVFTRFYMTLIHETGHELNKYGKVIKQDADGNYKYLQKPNGYSQDEQGYKAEEYIWGTDTYKPLSNPSQDNSPGIKGIMSDKYRPGVVEDIIDRANATPEGQESLPTLPTR